MVSPYLVKAVWAGGLLIQETNMTFFSFALRSRVLFTGALALGALTHANHAVAQSRSMIATIPFAFHDGSHTFPAGKYQIRCDSNILSVQSTNRENFGVHMTIAEFRTRTTENGKLIFNKYGDQYFLSDVWLARSDSGRKLVAGRLEKQLRGTPAKRPAPDNQVALNVQP